MKCNFTFGIPYMYIHICEVPSDGEKNLTMWKVVLLGFSPLCIFNWVDNLTECGIWQWKVVLSIIWFFPRWERSGAFNRNNPTVRGQMLSFNYDTAKIQIYKYANEQIHKYNYANTNTQMQIQVKNSKRRRCALPVRKVSVFWEIFELFLSVLWVCPECPHGVHRVWS